MEKSTVVTLKDLMTPAEIQKLILFDPEATELLASEVPVDPAKIFGAKAETDVNHNGGLEALFGPEKISSKPEAAKGAGATLKPEVPSFSTVLAQLENDALMSPMAPGLLGPVVPDAKIKAPEGPGLKDLDKLLLSGDFKKPSWEQVKSWAKDLAPTPSEETKTFLKDMKEGADKWTKDTFGDILLGASLFPDFLYGTGKGVGEWLARQFQEDDSTKEQEQILKTLLPQDTGTLTLEAESKRTANKREGDVPNLPTWEEAKVGESKKEKPENGIANALIAIGNAIGTWSFDPRTGSYTRTPYGKDAFDILESDEKRRTSRKESDMKTAMQALEERQADFKAALDLYNASMPKALGGSTVYDPVSKEYMQTENSVLQALKAQEVQTKNLQALEAAQALSGLDKKDQSKIMTQAMLAKKAGVDPNVYILSLIQQKGK